MGGLVYCVQVALGCKQAKLAMESEAVSSNPHSLSFSPCLLVSAMSFSLDSY